MGEILNDELAKYSDPEIRQSLYKAYANGFGDGYDSALADDFRTS